MINLWGYPIQVYAMNYDTNSNITPKTSKSSSTIHASCTCKNHNELTSSHATYSDDGNGLGSIMRITVGNTLSEKKGITIVNEKLLPPKRPLGITIIAFLNMIEGATGTFLLLLVVYFFIVKPHVYDPILFNPPIETLLGLYGIVTCIVGIGLFQVKIWAYWSEIILAIIYITYSILTVFQTPQSFASSLSSSIWYLVILVYLCMNTKGKAAFRSKNI